ncbi:MAG: hypothetical protein ACOCVX_05685, partial [Bacteroidales bacterium]
DKEILLLFAKLPSEYISKRDISNLLNISEQKAQRRLKRLTGWLKFNKKTNAWKMDELYQLAIREVINDELEL